MATTAELWRLLSMVNTIESKAMACRAEITDIQELEASGVLDKGETVVTERALEYITDLAIDMERHSRQAKKKAQEIRTEIASKWGHAAE